jgi:hypothetical protein
MNENRKKIPAVTENSYDLLFTVGSVKAAIANEIVISSPTGSRLFRMG